MNLAVIITLTVGWLAGIVAVGNILGARISDQVSRISDLTEEIRAMHATVRGMAREVRALTARVDHLERRQS